MKPLMFRGIEGSNPLGFLAALGAMRLCALRWPDEPVRLRWVREGGWRPEVAGVPAMDEESFCRELHESGSWVPLDAFGDLGNNLTVPLKLFADVVREASRQTTSADRRAAEFASAFGSDVFEDEDKGRIEFTKFCFITGSGHQHFLGTITALTGAVGVEHLHETLFGHWAYSDKGLSMRWDPDDAKEYALRWKNPSGDGVSTVWGANRLAFEALPLFPTVPTSRGLRTTGFHKRDRVDEFTWPIWSQPASLDTIRSLMGLQELSAAEPDRQELSAMGIEDVFRVQRVRIGQGANFKVSFRAASSV